jgi:hypothetical protein
VLAFFPMRPQARAQLLDVLALIGVRVGDGLRGGPQIAWHTGTQISPTDLAKLPTYAINRSCRDVSKSHVDALWTGVAGYSVSVDPLLTEGPLVIKSEENGAHDGRIASGPLRRRQTGMVYQRFIDATVGDVFVQTRPVVMRRAMPLVFEVHMPRPHWHADAIGMFPRQAQELYSGAEIAQLLAFASAVGLEYGELDVLRETATGRLFVLDANPTPVRPHFIAAEDLRTAQRLMADAFSQVFAADLRR